MAIRAVVVRQASPLAPVGAAASGGTTTAQCTVLPICKNPFSSSKITGGRAWVAAIVDPLVEFASGLKDSLTTFGRQIMSISNVIHV